jgi:quercetin dioxygenase-like cupin family protein
MIEAFDGMERACCALPGRTLALADIPENPHPAFAGVFLRCLIPGRETGGAVSLHLVRVAPGRRLDAHVHAGQWEVHEVAAGSGTAVIDGRETAYRPGVAALIPMGVSHEVRAGAEGLTLLATFAPALG